MKYLKTFENVDGIKYEFYFNPTESELQNDFFKSDFDNSSIIIDIHLKNNSTWIDIGEDEINLNVGEVLILYNSLSHNLKTEIDKINTIMKDNYINVSSDGLLYNNISGIIFQIVPTKKAIEIYYKLKKELKAQKYNIL